MGRVEQERVRQLPEQPREVEQGLAPPVELARQLRYPVVRLEPLLVLVEALARQEQALSRVQPEELLQEEPDLAVVRRVVSGPLEDSAAESLGRSPRWKGPS